MVKSLDDIPADYLKNAANQLVKDNSISFNVFADLGFENADELAKLSEIFAEICVLSKKNNPSRATLARKFNLSNKLAKQIQQVKFGIFSKMSVVEAELLLDRFRMAWKR